MQLLSVTRLSVNAYIINYVKTARRIQCYMVFSYTGGNSRVMFKFIGTVEPPNKGHVGDNINSLVLSFVERLSSPRRLYINVLKL